MNYESLERQLETLWTGILRDEPMPVYLLPRAGRWELRSYAHPDAKHVGDFTRMVDLRDLRAAVYETLDKMRPG